jgi:hypothetical protein
MSREVIYQALLDLASTVRWGAGQQFINPSRRVQTWSKIREFPTLAQAEHDETVTPRTNMPPVRTLGAVWLIYHNVGKDTSLIPATESNAILDAIDALFPSGDDATQTLGGLVHRASISGRVLKEHGDLEGQALLIVPIRLIAP